MFLLIQNVFIYYVTVTCFACVLYMVIFALVLTAYFYSFTEESAGKLSIKLIIFFISSWFCRCQGRRKPATVWILLRKLTSDGWWTHENIGRVLRPSGPTACSTCSLVACFYTKVGNTKRSLPLSPCTNFLCLSRGHHSTTGINDKSPGELFFRFLNFANIQFINIIIIQLIQFPDRNAICV